MSVGSPGRSLAVELACGRSGTAKPEPVGNAVTAVYVRHRKLLRDTESPTEPAGPEAPTFSEADEKVLASSRFSRRGHGPTATV